MRPCRIIQKTVCEKRQLSKRGAEWLGSSGRQRKVVCTFFAISLPEYICAVLITVYITYIDSVCFKCHRSLRCNKKMKKLSNSAIWGSVRIAVLCRLSSGCRTSQQSTKCREDGSAGPNTYLFFINFSPFSSLSFWKRIFQKTRILLLPHRGARKGSREGQKCHRCCVVVWLGAKLMFSCQPPKSLSTPRYLFRQKNIFLAFSLKMPRKTFSLYVFKYHISCR